VTIGGTVLSELSVLGDALATIVIGSSLNNAGKLLAEKTGVPSYSFNHLYGLKANDAFINTLAEISGEMVPEQIERQRAQLQDAMLDTHFMLGQKRIAIAADADLLLAFTDLIQEMGAEVAAAVTSCMTASLNNMPLEKIKIGDLEDMELIGKAENVQLVIGNSHAVDSAKRLHVPILRAGFPLYDIIGGYQKTWVGYRGSRQTLFDLANLVINEAHEQIPVYHSIYKKQPAVPSCH
jgi:nitrogenase molybdenum-iron protein NifN